MLKIYAAISENGVFNHINYLEKKKIQIMYSQKELSNKIISLKIVSVI